VTSHHLSTSEIFFINFTLELQQRGVSKNHDGTLLKERQDFIYQAQLAAADRLL
jgi:hypothetical protein